MKFRVLSVCVPLAILGCTRKAAPVPLSEAKHDVAKPVEDTSSWRWHETTDAEFEVIRKTGTESSAVLPDNSIPTRRVQFWLDLFDSKIRKASPALLANVPRPRAKVFKSAEVNGYVNRVVVCLPLGVDVTGGAASGGTDADVVLLETDGTYTALPKDACVVTRPDAAELDKRLADLNANRSGCRITKGSGRVTLSTECQPSPNATSAARGAQVAVVSTSNIVSIFGGLITEASSEDEVVAIIAHELGHFYRSHATAPRISYDYFYSNTGDANASHNPLSSRRDHALISAFLW